MARAQGARALSVRTLQWPRSRVLQAGRRWRGGVTRFRSRRVPCRRRRRGCLGWVAGTVIADLGEHAGGTDGAALGILEEDGSVGVRAHGACDLAGEPADLLDHQAQRRDEAENAGASCVGLELVDDGDGRATQTREELVDGSAATVGVACEECVQALGSLGCVRQPGWDCAQERQADRAVEQEQRSCRVASVRIGKHAELPRRALCAVVGRVASPGVLHSGWPVLRPYSMRTTTTSWVSSRTR
jgi:hypothetical protein